jgi:superfamily I DNA/RNA helicase
MAERVDRLLDHSSLAKPLICTFHSLCVRMLRRDIEALKVGNGEGLTRSFAIYDENDQQAIVKQIMKRMGLDTKQLTPRTVLGRISWAKNHMVDPQEYYLASKIPTASASPTSTRATRPSCARTTPSTSTICCWKPSACSRSPARPASATSAATAICWWTSTRTPTAPSTS